MESFSPPACHAVDYKRETDSQIKSHQISHSGKIFLHRQISHTHTQTHTCTCVCFSSQFSRLLVAMGQEEWTSGSQLGLPGWWLQKSRRQECLDFTENHGLPVWPAQPSGQWCCPFSHHLFSCVHCLCSMAAATDAQWGGVGGGEGGSQPAGWW
jgi:hypothetical protein